MSVESVVTLEICKWINLLRVAALKRFALTWDFKSLFGVKLGSTKNKSQFQDFLLKLKNCNREASLLKRVFSSAKVSRDLAAKSSKTEDLA